MRLAEFLLPVFAAGLTLNPAAAQVLRIPLGLDAVVPAPEENALTAEKIALGRKLFFDPRLSRDGVIACATCHRPELAFTDGRMVAVGVFGRKGARNVPTLVNRAYGSSFFLDGRSATLEQQVLKPIQDPNEMDLPIAEASRRGEVTPSQMSAALASFVRTILSGDAPIDRYRGGDREALSTHAREGFELFRGKANCVACHIGPNFTDESFHNTGIAWRSGRLLDLGRFKITSVERDRGAFKTPTLREVARTAPYMHDGSLSSLEEVIEFYDRGGRRNPYLDRELRPLRLTREERAALVVFLHALSGAPAGE